MSGGSGGIDSNDIFLLKQFDRGRQELGKQPWPRVERAVSTPASVLPPGGAQRPRGCTEMCRVNDIFKERFCSFVKQRVNADRTHLMGVGAVSKEIVHV